METKGGSGEGGGGRRPASIKRRFMIFSAVLFFIILAGGSGAFILSMRQIVHRDAAQELLRMVEIERKQLEASVNGEIAIALKMADSPLIRRYFTDPADGEIERLALEEIAGYRRAFAGNTVFWVNDVDKRYYFDDAYSYTIDTEDPNNAWYSIVLHGPDKYTFMVSYDDHLKKTQLWIDAMVYDAAKKPIGIVGTGIDLSAFIDTIFKEWKGDAALYFFNEAGEITGARDAELIASKISIASYLAEGEDILNTARGLSGPEIRFFTSPAGEAAVGRVPSLNWYIGALTPITIGDYLNTAMTGLFAAMMGVIFVIFIVFHLVIAAFLKPLERMVEALNVIASTWDLTRRLDIRQKDEIGTLADFFNLTFEKMMGLLKDIKGQAFSLSDTGEELSANMTETQTAIDRINSNIADMRGQVLTQSDAVNTAAGSMERIFAGLGKLNNHIAIQADSVAQSSSAIEEMLANIRSVTETLIRNTENINSLAEFSGAGRVDLQKVSTDIQEIARESEGLLEINSVMQNISSQTNLLSMNAAIEAAHAGESGKGFAVVADEIRKLAENSGAQSKTISAVLKKIKTSIDAITKSTSVVLERFGRIEEEVRIVSDQETQIRNAMEEQETGSRNILEAVTRLNSVTDLVQTASSEMAAESKEVMNRSGDLKRITGEVAGGMDEMTGSADRINNTVTRVKEISQENKENIEALSGAIARFKVE